VLKLAQLIWAHDQYLHESGLQQVLGDPCLLHVNPLFRSVREKALKHDFRFIADGSELAQSYEAAPMLMLSELLATKRIPYRLTVPPFRKLVRCTQEIAIEPALLISLASKNVVFHESLHGLGSIYIDEVLNNAGIPDFPDRFVIVSAFVEAFANSVERLSFHEVKSQLHLVFLSLNSYVSFSMDNCRLLADLVSHFGEFSVFKMAMGVLCLLNLRGADPSYQDLTLLAEAATHGRVLDQAELHFLTDSSRVLWGLAKGFRNDTSKFFYRMHGRETEYQTFLNQPSFAEPCTCKLMMEWAERMYGVIFHSVTSEYVNAGDLCEQH
jgi:hypothetical protein